MKYEKEIIAMEKSADHHVKMREWVKTRSKYKRPSYIKMIQSIGQAWGSSCCACCKIFNVCSYCPLDLRIKSCCNGMWEKMNNSKTWAEWYYWSGWVLAWIRYRIKKYRRMAKAE